MAREVKVSIVIDEHGAVKALRTTADESDKTEHKLGHLDKSVKELGKSFGGLKSMVGMGLGALGASGLAFGLKDIASKTGEIAEETHKFSSITGFGTNASLRYTAALKARGIGADAGGRMFAFLAKNVQAAERQQYMFATSQDKAAAKGKQATGLLGLQATAFKKLGIDLGQFHALSEEAKFDLVIKKFEALKAGSDKTDLAKTLFGKGGQEALQVLNSGALGLSHMTDMAKKFFPTITGGGEQAMDELMVKQAESKMAWEGLEFTLGEKLVPAMTTVDSWFSKLAVSIEHGNGIWGSLESAIGTGVHDFEDIYGWLGKSKLAVDALGYSLAGLGALWGGSKVLDFLSSIKKLTLISGISKMIGMGGAGAAAGEAGAAEAGAVGGASMLGPYAAIAAATIFAAHELHLFGENLGETRAMDQGKKKAGPRRLESILGQWDLHHPGAVAAGHGRLNELSPFNRQWLANGLRTRSSHPESYFNIAPGESSAPLVTELRRAADTVIHHQTILQVDGRVLAEANERYGLKRAARSK